GESAQKKFIFWGILNNTSAVADRGIDRPLPAAGALVHSASVIRLRNSHDNDPMQHHYLKALLPNTPP
ncbi:hypothetical protein, partial [uncultured Fibrobacter sp.]|uniref:hypothetical protein n=1 Tax=uncultured Fibrobacter sp. TaxID=261512 RepID=UPI00259ACA6D